MAIACEETREAVASCKKGSGRSILPKEKSGDSKIYIPSKKRQPGCETVRLTSEASAILEKLAKQTGQTKRYLVSELVVQGAKNIEFYPEDCSICEDRETCPHAAEARAAGCVEDEDD